MTEREVLEDLVQRAEAVLEGAGGGAVYHLAAGVHQARVKLGLEIRKGRWDPPTKPPQDTPELPAYWRHLAASIDEERKFEDFWMGHSQGLLTASEHLESAIGAKT